MRNLYKISTIVVLLFVMASCKVGNYVSSNGDDNKAKILLVSTGNFINKIVQVQVDNNVPFEYRIVSVKKSYKKDITLIPSGKHHLKIYYKGKLIYNQNIFIASSETKKIEF